MRWIVLAWLMALVAPAALAGETRYAVLSLIGDQLLVVEREMATGSRLDRNKRTFIAIAGHAVDREALFAVEDALKRHDGAARVVLLAARAPELFTAQARVLDAGGDLAALLPAVMRALAGSDATHLVLVTKYRYQAQLRVRSGYIGAGFLEGVGFYLDPSTRLEDPATGEVSEGFVAPFAYFRLALIDLATGRVVRDEAIRASATASRQDALTPWQSLSAEQKERMLASLIRGEIARVMPALLAR